MTQILQLICSARGAASWSTALSTAMVARLQDIYPDTAIRTRNLAEQALPLVDPAYADAAVSPLPDPDANSAALDHSKMAIDELRAADIVVIATPMHNFTVPAALKAWVDLVVRAFHTFRPASNGKIALLDDRPVFIAASSGGVFYGSAANQPDFLIPYLRAVLGCIGLRSIHVLPLQGTARRTRQELEQTIAGLIDQALAR